MANFDEFYKQAENWAKKNTLYFSYKKDGVENGENFLEGYFNLPEKYFDKVVNFEKVYDQLEKIYVLEKYINEETIVL